MTDDPRVRLLGADLGSAATGAAIAALDDTRVIIRTGPDVCGPHSIAVAALVALLARMVGDVVAEPPLPLTRNWWGVDTTDELLFALRPVRPRPQTPPGRDLVVTVGSAAGHGDWGIGGDDFTARLGHGPQPLRPADHALGVHAAVCLVTSQVLLAILQPCGFVGVPVTGTYVMNLVDYAAAPAPTVEPSAAAALNVAVAGVGSVATSMLALLTTALDSDDPVHLELIDDDAFDPTRNPFRYPALLGHESGSKPEMMAERLRALGLSVAARPVTVAQWTQSREQPGFAGLLVSSVDTVPGRADVTDVLARETLSLGVSGLALHAQRELFADGHACSFCDYVSAAPPLTQAGVHAQTTGLPVQRVLTLMHPGSRLEPADVDAAIAAGRVPAGRRCALIGARFTDLVRQAYAEAELRPATPGAAPRAGDVVAVAAPQVSWFAGVLGAVEIVKQLRGVPVLDRRVDADLAGLPPGVVRRPEADATGRCLCHSGIRRQWYRRLYLADDAVAHARDTDTRTLLQ